jgi:ABC-2 type transport system permease protein
VALTLLYALTVAVYGELQWAETMGSYLGFLFLGAGYISVGLFISALTENQLSAALVTFFCLLFILLMDGIAGIVPPDSGMGFLCAALLAAVVVFFIFLNTRNLFITAASLVFFALLLGAFRLFNQRVYSAFLQKFLGWFSLNRRYQSFSMGLLKADALVYYASFCAFFIFLTMRLIEKRRWN